MPCQVMSWYVSCGYSSHLPNKKLSIAYFFKLFHVVERDQSIDMMPVKRCYSARVKHLMQGNSMYAEIPRSDAKKFINYLRSTKCILWRNYWCLRNRSCKAVGNHKVIFI